MTPHGWNALELDTVSVAYPDGWTPDVQTGGEGSSVYLQSPAVSFGIVGVYSPEEDPQGIVEQVSDSVRAEHPGLELEPMDNDEDQFPDGVAIEGMFMTLDTVAYCWIRCWRIGNRCVLVYVQTVEPESADSEEVFHQLCESLGTAQILRRKLPTGRSRGLAEPGPALE